MPPGKQTPPPPPADPPAPSSAPPPGEGLEGRVSGLETEQQRQGGLLEQILNRLPGAPNPGGPAPGADPPPAGKSVADQVRTGIEALERERATAAEADANKSAREDYAARIKALEERAPAETVANPAGALRARAQRIVFGITESSR
jgi:hypothetical protein